MGDPIDSNSYHCKIIPRILCRASKHAPNLEDAVIRLSPDPLSPKSLLEFPVMLLYPMHNQSDFIKAWAEKDAIAHHLSYILPLPWDKENAYKQSTVDCYMDTVGGGLMRIYVVPVSLASQWIDEVKRKKGK